MANFGSLRVIATSVFKFAWTVGSVSRFRAAVYSAVAYLPGMPWSARGTGAVVEAVGLGVGAEA